MVEENEVRPDLQVGLPRGTAFGLGRGEVVLRYVDVDRGVHPAAKRGPRRIFSTHVFKTVQADPSPLNRWRGHTCGQ